MSEQVKPPTQVAGVAGIGDVPIVYDPPRQPTIEWNKLVRLPPFQMFVSERVLGVGEQSVQKAINYVQSAGASQDLYDAYCQWHKAKGKWPNETPMGELIEG